MNKSKIKKRLKQEEKYKEIFEDKDYIKFWKDTGEIYMQRRLNNYTTYNFFTQVMLSNVEGITVVGYDLENEKEKITFAFDPQIDFKVIETLSKIKNGDYRGHMFDKDDWKAMKKKRKQLINEYFEKL